MQDFNKVYLIGNLVKDPEVKNLEGGNKLSNFSLAVNRKWKSAEGDVASDVSYFDCVAFGKKAEIIGEYLSKGRRIFVEGRLKQDRWEDKETKKKQSKLRVVVENFHFMDSKKADTEAVPAVAGNAEGTTDIDDFDILD